LSRRKIEIVYFYSDLYESERKLSKVCRNLNRERRDLRIRLVNVEDPDNEDMAKLYDINMVPVIVFLTPKGEIAAKRCLPLSSKEVIEEVAERINKGELPNPAAEQIREKIVSALRSVTKRNDLTQLTVDQFINDIQEADSESELYELVNSHISALNHTMHDLQNFKEALQKFSRKQPYFVV